MALTTIPSLASQVHTYSTSVVTLPTSHAGTIDEKKILINAMEKLYGAYFCQSVSAEKIAALREVDPSDIGLDGDLAYPSIKPEKMLFPGVRGRMLDGRCFIAIPTKWTHPLRDNGRQIGQQIMYYVELIFQRDVRGEGNYVAPTNNPTRYAEEPDKSVQSSFLGHFNPSFLYRSGGMCAEALCNVNKLLSGERLNNRYTGGGFGGTFEMMDADALHAFRQKIHASLALASAPFPPLTETKKQSSTQEDYSISPPSPLHVNTASEPGSSIPEVSVASLPSSESSTTSEAEDQSPLHVPTQASPSRSLKQAVSETENYNAQANAEITPSAAIVLPTTPPSLPLNHVFPRMADRSSSITEVEGEPVAPSGVLSISLSPIVPAGLFNTSVTVSSGLTLPVSNEKKPKLKSKKGPCTIL